jgi:hypothetical protein
MTNGGRPSPLKGQTLAKQFQLVSFTQGEVVRLRFKVVTGEDASTFGAMQFTLRAGLEQPVVLVKTKGAGISIDAERRILVDLTAGETNALAGPVVAKEYLFDLWRLDAGSEVQMARGQVSVRPMIRGALAPLALTFRGRLAPAQAG